MAKITTPHDATPVDAPDDLTSTLETAGFDVALLVRRRDGAPLTDKDRKLLQTVLSGYEMGRDLELTDEQITDAVVRFNARGSATGTGG